jgi:hypothetical protein
MERLSSKGKRQTARLRSAGQPDPRPWPPMPSPISNQLAVLPRRAITHHVMGINHDEAPRLDA